MIGGEPPRSRLSRTGHARKTRITLAAAGIFCAPLRGGSLNVGLKHLFRAVMKHLERVHELDCGFGRAIVFFPEAHEGSSRGRRSGRCTNAYSRCWRWRASRSTRACEAVTDRSKACWRVGATKPARGGMPTSLELALCGRNSRPRPPTQQCRIGAAPMRIARIPIALGSSASPET